MYVIREFLGNESVRLEGPRYYITRLLALFWHYCFPFVRLRESSDKTFSWLYF